MVVGLATQYQIKYTSSLSHNISGVVKNSIQSFMGAAIYHTSMTPRGICGILLSVGGSISYAVERIGSLARNEHSLKKPLLPVVSPSQE